MSRANKKKTGSVRNRDGDDADGSKEGKSKKLEKQSLVADTVGVIAQFVEQTTEAQRTLMLVCHAWRDGVVFQNGCKPMDGVSFDWEALQLRQTKKLKVGEVDDADELFSEIGRHAAQTRFVQSIEFSGQDIGAVGLTSLRFAHSLMECFPVLRSLDLSQCPAVDDASMKSVSRIGSLEALFLLGTAVSDTGVAYLEKLSLRELSLSRTRITDAALKTVAKMLSLKQLHLRENTNLSDAGIAHLKALLHLEEIYLEGCSSLTDTALLHISSLKSLKTITAGSNSTYTDSGFTHLAAMSNLEYVDLSSTEITNGALNTIICELKSIRSFCLFGCDNITEEIFEKLRDLPLLQRLDLRLCERIAPDAIVHLLPLQSLCTMFLDRTQRAWIAVLDCFPKLTALSVTVGESDDLAFHHLSRLSKVSTLRLLFEYIPASASRGLWSLSPFQLNCLLKMPSLKTIVLYDRAKNYTRQFTAKGINCIEKQPEPDNRASFLGFVEK